MLIYFRSMFTVLFNLKFIKYDKEARDVNTSIKLIFSGISVCGMGVTFNSSVKFIYMAETAILFNMMGIWVSLISVYYRKTTKPSLMLLFSIALSFLGLIMISRPEFLFNSTEQDTINMKRGIGLFLGLLSSVFGTAYYVYS